MNNPDIDQMLKGWFDDIEPRDVPPQLLGAVFGSTRQTAQRGKLTARWRASLADARSWATVRLSPVAAVVLLALLVVALVAAAAVGSRLLEQGGPGWRILDRSEVDGGFTWVSQVASGGPGFVAVGATASPGGDECERAINGRIWTSADGSEWTDQAADLLVDTRVERVLASGGALYALATTGASCAETSSPSYSTLVSSDGQRWARLPDTGSFEGSFVVSLVDVHATPLALALYQDAEPPDGTGAGETRVWRLAGEAWELIATIEGVFISDAAAIGDIVVATGTDQQGALSTWRSTDGSATWSRTRTGSGRVAALEAFGDRFVALADGQAMEGKMESATLTSEDGSEWLATETLTGFAHDMWADEGGVVALTTPPSNGECAEWASPGSVPVALPSDGAPSSVPSAANEPDGSSDVCVRLRQATQSWYSIDGSSWRAAIGVPETMGDPPVLTQPVPANSYSVAFGAEGLVVTNPTFGGRVWFTSLRDFAPDGP